MILDKVGEENGASADEDDSIDDDGEPREHGCPNEAHHHVKDVDRRPVAKLVPLPVQQEVRYTACEEREE